MEISTDNQLARAYLGRLNRLSVFLSLAVLVVFFIGREEGLFGLSHSYSLKTLLAFDVTNPWRFYGLTSLSSFFVHAGSKHLLSNVFWLALLGFWLENKIGSKKFLLLLMSGHAWGLFISYWYLVQQGVVDNQRFVLGSSGAVLCLIGFGVFSIRRFFCYVFAMALLIAIILPALTHGSSVLSILNHIAPYFWGLLLGYLEMSRTSHSPSRPFK